MSTVAVAATLAGNWSWTVWLLIPLVVVLAIVTSLVLGSGGEASRDERRQGGVSRYLAGRGDEGKGA